MGPAACRKGERSALVEHAASNTAHGELVGDMARALHRVPLVSGVGHRLSGKIAIVTGTAAAAATAVTAAQCPALRAK